VHSSNLDTPHIAPLVTTFVVSKLQGTRLRDKSVTDIRIEH